MSLTVRINTGAVDGVVGGGGTEWTSMDVANDYLVFSAGSAVVADGLAIPSQSDYNQAGTIISDLADVIVSKMFLADADANLLKECTLWGDNNGRYVIAFDFSAATASEPVLEIWDDSNLNTTDNLSLGDGTPANSWWYGVVTNDAAPGSSWAGTALAGNGVGRYLTLNDGDGALGGATVLYCNLKIIIPQSTSTSGQETPVIVVKYTTN